MPYLLTVSLTLHLQVRPGIADRETRGAPGIAEFAQACLDRWLPSADHGLDLRAQGIAIGVARRLAAIEGVADQRDAAVAHVDRPAEHLGIGRTRQKLGNRHPPRRRQVVAREPDKGKQVTVERVFGEDKFGARPVSPIVARLASTECFQPRTIASIFARSDCASGSRPEWRRSNV